ncbi:MAG: non-canonical purine NTP diphosphatase [Crocinitomicaceae bacterium]|nr:non-canonical purine NTP diphosphatase [Crocinitomicaceae bacterium]
MKLIFATHNAHKAKEIQKMLPESIQILTLEEIGCFDEIPETADTLEGNASLKSSFVKDHYGVNCFADDTGLEIEALNGEPGVLSARYAGETKDPQANMDLVLSRLEGNSNRKARFRTVISLWLNEEEYLFEGIVDGTIRTERSGAEGFGYDPIFQPDGYEITFAEMSMDEKNKISHRGRAVQKLVDFLSQLKLDK